MQGPYIAESARKWGVTDEDMLHAWRNVVDSFLVGEGMTMLVGPATDGAMLEVGIVEARDESGMVIVHAMSLRRKFTR